MASAAPRDEIDVALESLSRALEEITKDQVVLLERLRVLRDRRATGAPWREILADDDEPPAMQLLSQILRRLSVTSGEVRRSVVMVLRGQGVSLVDIAQLLGVTHQRIANIQRAARKADQAAE